MKHLISIPYRNALYRCTVDASLITSIIMVFEDSGIHRDVRFDDLPEVVKDQLLNRIRHDNE